MKAPTPTLLQKALAACMAISLTAMAILVFTNVVLRYLFDSGITWSEEMSRYLFVFMIFFGTTLAFIERQHLSVDMLVERLPPVLRRACTLICGLAMLYALWLLMDGGWQLMWINQNSRGPATGFPLWTLYGGAVVMGAVMAACIVARFVQQCRASSDQGGEA